MERASLAAAAVVATVCAVWFSRRRQAPRGPHVVILGAAFGGGTVMRRLAGARVTVVDQRNFLEYTPAILRAFLDASLWPALSAGLPAALPPGTAFTHGAVTAVVPHEGGRPGADVHVRLHGTGEVRVLSADVVVIATGSAYPLAKPAQGAGSGTSTAAARAGELAALASRLALARHVLVVGGGPVGVELAAELVCAPPKGRTVTLLSSARDLLVGMHPAMGVAAGRWLTARGVSLLLGDRVPGLDLSARAPERADEREVVTAAGRVLTVDCVLPAVGTSASTAWAAPPAVPSPAPALPPLLPSGLASALDGRGKLRVQRTGEVEGFEGRAIFALGDCASHPHREADLAHTAEKQGAVVAANVRSTLRGRGGSALREYPHPAFFTPPVIFAVSLGPHAALMDFNGRILLTDAYVGQRLASWAKGTIQVLQVALMRGHALGALLWDVVDACSEWTSWLVPPVVPAPAVLAPRPAVAEAKAAGERSPALRRRSTTGAAFA